MTRRALPLLAVVVVVIAWSLSGSDRSRPTSGAETERWPLVGEHAARSHASSTSAALAVHATDSPDVHTLVIPGETSRRVRSDEPEGVASARAVGRVVDDEGRPVSGALVHAHPASSDDPRTTQAVLSDADGRFALAGRPGVWSTFTQAAGHVSTAATPTTVTGSTRTPWLIQLVRHATLRTTVVDDVTGVATDGAVVHLTLVRPAAPRSVGSGREALFGSKLAAPGRTQQVDVVEGVAFVEALHPGEYEVAATRGSPPRDDAVERLYLAPGVTTLTRLRLPPAAAICGRLLGRHGAASGGQVALLDARGQLVADARADDQGAFLFPGLSGGTFTVVAQAQVESVPVVRVVDLEEGQLHRVTLRLGTVRLTGQVVERGQGRGAPGAEVLVKPVPRDDERDDYFEAFGNPVVALEQLDLGFSFRTTTDERGHFSLRVPDRPFLVSVRGGPYLRAPSLHVRPPVDGQRLELHVQRGATLHGRVFGPDESDPGDLIVGIHGEHGLIQQTPVVDGAYRLEGLEPGSYQVTLEDLRAEGALSEVPLEIVADEETVLDLGGS